MTQQKIFMNIILVIVIVVILGTVGYLTLVKKSTSPITETNQQQMTIPTTQDETVDWKTYRNEEYGFEVRYPENFAIEINPWNTTVKNPSEIVFFYPNSREVFYEMKIIDTAKPREMSNFFDKPETYTENFSPNQDINFKSITTNGTEWKRYYYIGGAGYEPSPSYVLKKNNLI